MEGSAATDERVVLESDGWQLMGEWRAPPARERVPAALLLHRAAGSRGEYAALADALARRGVASLRLDLRGHGESDNLGRFEEPFAENRHILEKTYRDVDTALGWIKAHPAVAASSVAVAGASYSGEAIGEARREGGESAAAYVILSPGSFSDASIAEVDRSDVPWLFMRTTQEDEVSLPFIDVRRSKADPNRRRSGLSPGPATPLEYSTLTHSSSRRSPIGSRADWTPLGMMGGTSRTKDNAKNAGLNGNRAHEAGTAVPSLESFAICC
jgi:pimeloyl-ACP methyl ester carboxylesterase